MAHNLFRPMTPGNEDILVAGQAHVRDSGVELEPQGQHLVYLLGGLFALGAKLFGRGPDLDVARKLVDGCIYTHRAFPHGVMPETFFMVPCPSKAGCAWDASPSMGREPLEETRPRARGRDARR